MGISEQGLMIWLTSLVLCLHNLDLVLRVVSLRVSLCHLLMRYFLEFLVDVLLLNNLHIGTSYFYHLASVTDTCVNFAVDFEFLVKVTMDLFVAIFCSVVFATESFSSFNAYLICFFTNLV